MSAGREPWEDEPGWLGGAEREGGGEGAPDGPGAETGVPPGSGETAAESANGGTAPAVEPSLRDVHELLRQIAGRIDGAGNLRPGNEEGEALRADIRKLTTIAGKLKKQGEENRSLAEETIEAGKRDRGAWKGMADRIEEAVAAQNGDFAQWAHRECRRKRWLSGAALAAAVPAVLLLGVLMQKEFEVVPLHDPSGGWRAWIWENHGAAIADCASEARRRGEAVECPLAVRGPRRN